MSEILSEKKTIAIFQNGLGDTGGSDLIITKLKEKSVNAVIDSNRCIDMKYYDPSKKSFFGFNANGSIDGGSDSIEAFSIAIANIVALAQKNKGKTILVRTSLDTSFYGITAGVKQFYAYDSIEFQAIRLVHIINKIKELDNGIQIILIGHSQGGLVNLYAATEIPEKISQMISISTPYSPVQMAKELIHLNFLASIFGTSAYELIQQNKAVANKYKERVEALGGDSFYDEVKDKWESLASRPPLTVIAGVSGHLEGYIYGTPPAIMKYPFDGLVTISEQTNITHANIIGLTDKNLECYKDKQYMENVCYLAYGNSYSCKRNCSLTSFSVTSALFKAGLDLIKAAVAEWTGKSEEAENEEGEEKDDGLKLDEISIINDIYLGVGGEEIADKSNEKYYKVYRSDYSHSHLRECDETIGIILSKFVS